jgi:hypothetical protein
MTEPGHLSPKETDEQRLPWHRRPRTLLGVLLAGLIASIPFAIRGYQLSRIPNVPNPFDGLPAQAEVFDGAASVLLIQRFREDAAKLRDDGYWLNLNEVTADQRRAFSAELKHASKVGLDDASESVVRFATESEPLIADWHEVFDWFAANPPQRDLSEHLFADVPYQLQAALLIATQKQVDLGNYHKAVDLLLSTSERLRKVPVADLFGYWATQRLRNELHDATVRIAEIPGVDSRILEKFLSEARAYCCASRELQIDALRANYRETMDDLSRRIPTSWDGRITAFVLGEPELSQRIVRQLFTNYRDQLLVPHIKRPSVVWLTNGEMEWFDTASSKVPTRQQLDQAVADSLFLSEWGTGVQQSIFISGLHAMFEMQKTHIEHVRIALACQLYLRKHGSLPRSLADLVPEYLPAVPEDPLTKSDPQLLYRKDSSAAVVYSRGWNGTDDGGLVLTDSDSDWSEDDFGILIRDLINHPEQAVKPTQAAFPL